MFDNIGNKIKIVAKIITGIGMMASFIACLFILMLQSSLWSIAIVIAVLGSLISWLGSFLLYGFGELIDQATISNKKLQTLINKTVKNETEKE